MPYLTDIIIQMRPNFCTCTRSVLVVFCVSPPSRAGQLVLMDAGCEFHGYVSDVTRTWPVGGAFTTAQRELYLAVQRVKQNCTEVGGGQGEGGGGQGGCGGVVRGEEGRGGELRLL